MLGLGEEILDLTHCGQFSDGDDEHLAFSVEHLRARKHNRGSHVVRTSGVLASLRDDLISLLKTGLDSVLPDRQSLTFFIIILKTSDIF